MAERLTLTVAEVAQALGIGRNQAYRAVQRGELPHVRIGRRVLVPRVALERWLSSVGHGEAGTYQEDGEGVPDG